MNWKNLIKNQCPKCSTQLVERGACWYCRNQACDFLISRSRKLTMSYDMENKFSGDGKRNFEQGFGQ